MTNHDPDYTPSVVLTINKRTNRVFRSIRSSNAPEIPNGTLARTAIFRLLRDGFVEASVFVGDTFTVLGFVKHLQDSCEIED